MSSSEIPLRTVILGGGAVTRLFYLPAFAGPLSGGPMTLEAVVDPSSRALQKLEELAPGVSRINGSYQEFLDCRARGSEFNAAVIALPHHLHEDAVRRSLDAGLHVFCEKPLALDPPAAQRMIDAAHTRQLVLAVCQPRRSYPAARAIRAVIERRIFGRLERIEWFEGQPYAWPAESLDQLSRESGGEEVYDIGAHVLDLLCAWAGPLQLNDYRDDSRGGAGAEFQLSLQSDAGVDVQVQLSRLFPLVNTAALEFERGRVVWDLKKPHAVTIEEALGEDVEAPQLTFEPDADNPMVTAFACQLGEFVQAVLGHPADIVSADEALHYTRVFEQCRQQQALQSKGPVVRVPQRSSRRSVVTGAAGFIGCALVERLLKSGEDPLALIRRPQSCVRLARNHVDIRGCDILDRLRLERHFQGVEVVYHCAVGGEDAARVRDVIVTGTENVLQAAESCGVRRVVVFSSMLAIGEPPAEGTVTEDTPKKNSILPYGRAKLEMEKRCEAFATNSRTEVVILEPTCVFGPFGKDFGGAQLDQMLDNAFFLLEDGRGTANLVFVDNLIDAALLAAHETCTSGRRYIVSQDESQITWREFFETLWGAAAAEDDADLLSLSRDEIDGILAHRKRLRSFPAVLRRAVRSDPLARTWVSQNRAFRMWKRVQHTMRSPFRSVRASGPAGKLETARSVPDNPPRACRKSDLCDSLRDAERCALAPEFQYAFFDHQAVYSSERIRSELGWEPKVELSAACAVTQQWARRYCGRTAASRSAFAFPVADGEP